MTLHFTNMWCLYTVNFKFRQTIMAQIILKKIHIQIVFQLSSKKNDSLSIFQFSNTFFFLVGSQIFNFLAYMEPSRLLSDD